MIDLTLSVYRVQMNLYSLYEKEMDKWHKSLRMAKYKKVIINGLVLYAIVTLNISCKLFNSNSNNDPLLTIVINRTYPEIQRDFRVYDLNSNLWFNVKIKDSVYQICQSVLPNASLIFISGIFSHVDHIEYKKSGKNDTIWVVPKYVVPITIKE